MSYLLGDRVRIATQKHKSEQQFIDQVGVVLHVNKFPTPKSGVAHDDAVLVRLDQHPRNLWFNAADLESWPWGIDGKDIPLLLEKFNSICTFMDIWPSGDIGIETQRNTWTVEPMERGKPTVEDYVYAMEFVVLRELGEWRIQAQDQANTSGESNPKN